MRKLAIAVVLATAVFGLSGAVAHNERDEAHRDCGASPVHTDESSFIAVCVQDVGYVFLGSNGQGGGTIAVDGAKEAGSSDESADNDPSQWLDGYVRVDLDDDEGLHVYCAGNGSFENGAEADDELVLLNPAGDCFATP